jgi:hypothetical protein
MAKMQQTNSPIRGGDIDGRGRVYSEFGSPILNLQETILAQRENCEVSAYRSWRTLFPGRIFHPLPGKPAGTIYLTSERLIFLRPIDVWKEVKPLLTPLGLPTAVEKESTLRGLQARGARQYCEVVLPQLHLADAKRKPWYLRCRLIAKHGGRFSLFMRTDRDDPVFLELVERTIRHAGARP